MDKSSASELSAAVDLAAHARGLVFVHVSSADTRAIARTPLRELEEDAHPRAQWRAEVKRNLAALAKDAANLRGDAVSVDFLREVLLADNDPQPLRTDSEYVLVLQTLAGGAAGKTFKTVPVGVVTYGAAEAGGFGGGADGFERRAPFEDAALQASAEQERLLEVDFVGVTSSVKVGGQVVKPAAGTGTLLLLHVLATQLKRQSRGAPKYQGAIMELAVDKDGRAPLMSIATRLGFKEAALQDGGDDSGVVVVALHGTAALRALRTKLPTDGPIAALCPTSPRSGIPRCK